MDTCKSCIFFNKNAKEGDSKDTWYHECRKNAPRILAGSGAGWSDQLFPFVKETDWCGEYEQKDYRPVRHL